MPRTQETPKLCASELGFPAPLADSQSGISISREPGSLL